jgi:hypothetical protein
MKYNLTWTPNADCTSQEIYRSNTIFSRDNPPEPFEVLSNTADSFEDDTIVPWEQYYYSIGLIRTTYDRTEKSLSNLISVGYNDEAITRITPRPVVYNRPYAGVNFLPDGMTVVRDSPATTITRRGLIETVGSNILRQEYHDGVLLGWRNEDEATNIILQSDDISVSSSWTPIRATSTSVSVSATNTFNPFVSQVVSGLVIAQNYTMSVNMPPSNEWASIFIGGGGTESRQWVNTLTGETGSADGTLPTTATVRNYISWNKFTTTFTAPATSVEIRVEICNADGSVSASAIGDTIIVSGFQIEEGSFATSNISTGSTTAARDTDEVKTPLATVPGFPTDGSGFSVYWFGRTAPGIGSASQYFGSLDDDTTDNAVWWFRTVSNDLQLYVISGGVTEVFIVGPQIAGEQHVHMAATIQNNNTYWVLSVKDVDLGNGVGKSILAGTDTDCAVPSGLTTWVDQNRSDLARPGNGITEASGLYSEPLPVDDLMLLCDFP